MIQQDIFSVKNDIALIQCFWGTDLKRLSNAVECIRQFLLSRDSFKDWIIVEAQKTEDQATLKWTQQFGIKYIFKQFDDKSDGIFLKMPLWNIGAESTTCQYLCFTDMDVYFQASNWSEEVSKAFQQYDVISLHKTVTSLIDPTTSYQSIGYAIRNADVTGKLEYSYSSYTLGMTRAAYETFGKFDAVNYLDDQWFWQKLVGRKMIPNGYFTTPYQILTGYEDGYPVKIGSTDLTLYHVGNDNINLTEKYKLAQSFSYAACKEPMEDIVYDKSTLELPIWANTSCGKLMQKCFIDLFNGTATEDTVVEHSKEIYGAIDDDHPLIIMTMFYPDYKHKDSSCILKFKQNLDKYCKDPYTFICVSTEDIPNINIIPFKRDNSLSKIELVQKYIIDNKNIKYPENSTIAYIDVDHIFAGDMSFVRTKEISIYL